MKRIILIILIGLSLGVISCKKKHNITIQAQDYITGDGSAYAGMSFSVIQSRPGYPEDKIKTVYEGVLEHYVYASFDLKMHRDWVYVLSVSQPDNICYGDAVIHYLENESSNFVPIDYLKCGSLNVNFVNMNCEGVEDEFRFKYYHTNDTSIYIYWAFWGSAQTNLTGCQNAVSPVYYDRPVGNYTLEWEAIRQSGTTYGTETFDVFENDSTTYLIEY